MHFSVALLIIARRHSLFDHHDRLPLEALGSNLCCPFHFLPYAISTLKFQRRLRACAVKWGCLVDARSGRSAICYPALSAVVRCWVFSACAQLCSVQGISHDVPQRRHRPT
ncbi:hypothetical protein MIND_00913700 [Mycena indigotica]|uniref:Uncharacterized protein n=1 Tax=Mycena indigotica TaxID=2126181 RepID=A0A8H6SDA0_9AGAR|nr:uncharacterized protein MIND_00913700 [Mycena indigotica]KAF7296827.1 hypothetical protein MIND_00913700 [Mycena indigotica]